MSKRVQAFELSEGQTFRWKGYTYLIIRYYYDDGDDSLAVQEEGLDTVTKFNPYTWVEIDETQ